MKHLKYMILLCLFCLTGIAAQAQTGPADNEIWYTAAAKLPDIEGTGTTAGLHYEVFEDAGGNVLTMTSHTYEEATGKGVVTFDGAIATVGYRAFYKAGLTSVTLPECVTTIGEYAFGSCSQVTSIKFPASLTTIVSNAFNNAGLTTIDIPKTVTTIGNNAFRCNNLSKLKVHWPEGVDESKIDMNMVFTSRVSNVEYRIPAGSWEQNGRPTILYTLIQYLTFRQDPNNKTDYYATFYTNLQTGRFIYCYDLTGTGIKAYTGELGKTDDPDVDVLKLKDAGNIIGQGIAVVLKYTGEDQGPTIDIDIPTSSETAQTVEQNDLTGKDINLSWNGEGERQIPDNTYVLTASVPDGVIGFYPWNGNGKTIDAHKAYITLDGTNGGTKAVKCVFEK